MNLQYVRIGIVIAGIILTTAGSGLAEDYRIAVLSEPAESNKEVSSAIGKSAAQFVRKDDDKKQQEQSPEAPAAKLSVDISTLVSLGLGSVRYTTTIAYSILRNAVSDFTVALPPDVVITAVEGNDIANWKIINTDSQQRVTITLLHPVRDSYQLTIAYEKHIGSASLTMDLAPLTVIGTEWQTGTIGIEAQGKNIEITAKDFEEAETVDISELPKAILTSTRHPLVLGFRYFSPSYRISIDIEKQKDVPILIAKVEEAYYSTLLTREGKLLAKAVYTVRNNAKQFLKVELPEGAQLWSCFVDNSAARPGKDKEGRITIPLRKSEKNGAELSRFSVEIVYLIDHKDFKSFGRTELLLPKIDLPQVHLAWDVYTPKGYLFWYYGGNAEKLKNKILPFEAVRSGLRQKIYATAVRGLIADNCRTTGKLQTDESLEAMLKEARSAGAFPVKIAVVPQVKAMHFEKLFVVGEAVRVSFMYVRMPGWFLALLCFVCIGGIGWMLRRAIADSR
jgi:hypothetical protein